MNVNEVIPCLSRELMISETLPFCDFSKGQHSTNSDEEKASMWLKWAYAVTLQDPWGPYSVISDKYDS